MKRLIKKIILMVVPFIAEYDEICKSLNRTIEVSFIEYLKFHFKRKKTIYWPVHKTTLVANPKNIFVGINSNPGLRGGCYLQGSGKVFIGDYVRCASNVGIMSGNHNVYNHKLHENKETIIGDYSWIGMNSIILPGVVLGKRTIVGAGSVVTKSFPEGYCIIAGNPAKLIKTLDADKVVKYRFEEEYYGYIPKNKFNKFRDKNLNKLEFNFEMSKVTENILYNRKTGI